MKRHLKPFLLGIVVAVPLTLLTVHLLRPPDPMWFRSHPNGRWHKAVLLRADQQGCEFRTEVGDGNTTGYFEVRKEIE